MDVLQLAKIIHLSTAFMYVTAENVLYLSKFTRKAELDEKQCVVSDILFQRRGHSSQHCCLVCEKTYGCLGVMYNTIQNTCVGCKGDYNKDTILTMDTGVKYFKSAWLYFDGHLFIYSSEKLLFDSGIEYCERYGGFLARIDSDSKQQFLQKVSTNYGNTWIGLTDKGQEGIWTWLNDDTVTNYTNWYPGEDRDIETKDCITAKLNLEFKWVQRKCDTKFWVLCEKHGIY